MKKQFKVIMVLVNVLLSVLYIYSSYHFWGELNSWYDWNIQCSWTPFYVYPHQLIALETPLMPLTPILNIPFIIFCIITVTNCVMLAIYFGILRIQRFVDKKAKTGSR